MNGLLESYFANLPFVKFDGILLNRVQATNVLFVSAKNENVLLERNHT